MLESSDSSVYRSAHGLTITIRTLPGDGRRAYMCLAGEIDRDSSAILSRTVDWLTRVAPVSVLVDLAALTFACSALPNFLASVRHAVPGDAEVVLWRPRPEIEWVLRATDMAAIATIRGEPTGAGDVR
ncbi:hypothetical protein AB0G04_40265 [Actinoplanes sp. NPDC023801]|uniref:hypothetical protein n=1 Tax=Actinoplanes sp. NPDC023801 TaxID=3154595 RepID=UPI0033FD17F7